MERLTLLEYITKIVLPAFGVTLRVLTATTILSVLLGFILAIILVVTKEDGLHPNKYIYRVLDLLINLIRSFPFVILLVSLVPVTRAIVGSSIGEKAAVFPLTISMCTYVARLIASHLNEVDEELIEAAKSFGASNLQIIYHVIIVEAIPGIASVICFTIIAGLGATTAAGMVGAGGLGNVAIRYGYQNFNYPIMYSTIFILVILVQLIQYIGNKIYLKLK